MAATQSTSHTQVGNVVDVEIAGRVRAARVLDEDFEAAYGRGPERVLKVEVPTAGTFRVTEGDILTS